jgi:hypothetical protein
MTCIAAEEKDRILFPEDYEDIPEDRENGPQ